MTLTAQQHAALFDMTDWPRSWAREESDREIGERIIEELKPILAYIVSQGLTLATLQRYRHGLYLLGDKILEDFTRIPEHAPSSVTESLNDLLSEEGGPELSYLGVTEEAQRAYSQACRKAYRFLQQKGVAA